MPLNYSKWDNLELSDDSDVEGHPNIDKKSLIRWKQRDIHEKREARKHRIAQLKADLACNQTLEPRLKQIAADVEAQGPAHFSSLVERFKHNPSPDAPPTNAPQQKTYDEMLLSLMLTIWEDVKKEGVQKDDPKLGDALVKGLKKHVVQIAEHQALMRKDIEREEEEQRKKITMDDIHDGFESHYVPPKPEPPPIKGHIDTATAKPKKTEFEVINPKGVAAASDSFASSSSSAQSEDFTELPELTPTLEQFSHLPLKGYEKSWEFIKSHRDTIVPGASDALLVAAFTAQSDGHPVYAKKCVHQSLLLQYCDKLGKDGVTIFFRKMVGGDPRATIVFEKDVQDTYAHLVERVRISKAEQDAAGPGEQIQLVPENPSQSITFNVPDGPPPEQIQLEGPGLDNVDINDVKKALQTRWDIFQAFSPKLREALKAQSLDEVNKVLGSMKVEDAEEVVKLLDMGGILSFSDTNIRDQTGNGDEADGEDEGDGEDEDGDAGPE